MDNNKIKIFLGSKVYKIPMKLPKLVDVSDNIFSAIFQDSQHQYIVRSKVSDEVMESFIKFWVDEEIPEIRLDNFHQYSELSDEFGLLQEIIEEKRKEWDNYDRVIQGLNDPNITDKTLLVKEITNDLDNYLVKHGQTLMNQPIEILINIFNQSWNKFELQNVAYKLIKEKYLESGDKNIFVLLKFIDGQRLNHEYLRESFEERSNRNNFMPYLEFSYLSGMKEGIEIFKEKQIEINQNNEKEQEEQKKQIQQLQQYISKLEERLNSIENKIDEQNDQTYNNIANVKTIINDQKDSIDQKLNELFVKIQRNGETTANMKNNFGTEINKINSLNKENEKTTNIIKASIEDLRNKINLFEYENGKQKSKIIEIEENLKSNLNKIEKEKEKEKIIFNCDHSSKTSISQNLYRSIKNKNPFDRINLQNYDGQYIYKPITRNGPGILSYLKETSKNVFDRQFIVSLSRRDPYNLLLDDWNGKICSLKKGDFYLEITFENPIEMTGFEIFGSKTDFLRSYEIFIDEQSILMIHDDTKMRDDHKSRHDFAKRQCKKFKLVQTSPSWIDDNMISIRKIEFYTVDHPTGLIKYWNEQNTKKDHHLFPIKIDSNHFSTEDIHDLNSTKFVSTTNSEKYFCEIKFLNGVVSVEGYRLNRKFKNNKLKGWKIIGQTLSNNEITIAEFSDSLKNSDPLHISESNEIKSNEFFKSLKIYRTENNWDNTKFLQFYHFDIFGQYVPSS